MVAQFCKFPKSDQVVFLKWVNFMVYKLYLNKAVKMGKKELVEILLALTLRSQCQKRCIYTTNL